MSVDFSIDDVILRDAVESDMTAVQAIYAHHVLHGVGSYEETPPDVDTMINRWRAVKDGGFPYMVAEESGRILGYTYATQFRPRSAYRFALENSVYVADGMVGKGIGRFMLRQLIERCTALGYRQMIAVIGGADNLASINMHAAAGFERVGLMKGTGFKFGRWIDTVLMQRTLGDGDTTTPS